MITGSIKTQVDQIWNAFWTGGIANPLEVMEQITYLLFLRRLDDLHTLEENKSARLKRPMERRVFPTGLDGIGKNGGRSFEELRWSRFKNLAPAEMYGVVSEHVFPFLRTLGGDDSTYAHHMKDARFTIPTPASTTRRTAADCGGAGPGGGAAGQAPRHPRSARHPHPVHFPRHVRQSCHESEGVAGGVDCRPLRSQGRKATAQGGGVLGNAYSIPLHPSDESPVWRRG